MLAFRMILALALAAFWTYFGGAFINWDLSWLSSVSTNTRAWAVFWFTCIYILSISGLNLASMAGDDAP